MILVSQSRRFLVDLVAGEEERQRVGFDAQELACLRVENTTVDLISDLGGKV
jgi:hypothetical protein